MLLKRDDQRRRGVYGVANPLATAWFHCALIAERTRFRELFGRNAISDDELRELCPDVIADYGRFSFQEHAWWDADGYRGHLQMSIIEGLKPKHAPKPRFVALGCDARKPSPNVLRIGVEADAEIFANWRANLMWVDGRPFDCVKIADASAVEAAGFSTKKRGPKSKQGTILGEVLRFEASGGDLTNQSKAADKVKARLEKRLGVQHGFGASSIKTAIRNHLETKEDRRQIMPNEW